MRIRHRRTARALVLLAALGMFAGGSTASAASSATGTQDECIPRPPHGWFC